MAASIIRAIMLASVWLALAGTKGEALIVGALVVPCAVWLSLGLWPPAGRVRIRAAMALVLRFVWRSVVGGLDVARRACDPRLPLAPGLVQLPTRLPPAGRVVLGAGLSLMPGTLCLGSVGRADGSHGVLLVHALDTTDDVASAIREEEQALAALLPGGVAGASGRGGASGGASGGAQP